MKRPRSRLAHVRRSPCRSSRSSKRLIALHCGIALCGFALCALQGCGGGSSASHTATPLAITTTSLAGGTVTVSYSATLTAQGGTGSGYAWSLSAGALPGGIALSSGGILSGTPTAPGTFNFTASVTDSSETSATSSLSLVIATASPLTNYEFTGDTSPVHDPSIIRQGSTYYAFSTDASSTQGGFIPIRCSTDNIAWTACGYVFDTLPSWVSGAVPQATEIWAPDVSYFNGAYHVYYAVSSFGSNISAIGLVTNPTLDLTDPNYNWVDQGLVLQSLSSDNFNAIDPNILIDAGGFVWLTYGSFWTGIYQQQIDPATGKIQSGSAIYHLAERASDVANDPIEGPSLVYKTATTISSFRGITAAKRILRKATTRSWWAAVLIRMDPFSTRVVSTCRLAAERSCCTATRTGPARRANRIHRCNKWRRDCLSCAESVAKRAGLFVSEVADLGERLASNRNLDGGQFLSLAPVTSNDEGRLEVCSRLASSGQPETLTIGGGRKLGRNDH